MRGKLSHPTRPLRSGHPAALRRGSEDPRLGSKRAGLSSGLLASTAVLLCTVACHEIETGTDSPSSATNTPAIEPASHAAYSWPDDPSHPVLEISVESPDSKGTILIELMPELAPATVVNVIELANEGFYDGTTFHRVIPGFMIQGGDPNSRDRDPTNDGKGAPGRTLHDEFGQSPFVRGVVGMGNKGRRDSTSTQFFIMQADNRGLDGHYTPIGRVLSGIALVDDITQTAIDRTGRWGPKDRPIENVVMTKVRTVGQVLAVKLALALDAQSDSHARVTSADLADLRMKPASERTGPSANDDGERLEALGR
ncbi:MAG: peptidylprolyl isomerase [bacterium]|nr:hypothetical protein [Deltaproteobacteria bacterium]MCP4907812.1 peptidylprolyl isomerase [bacterium]